MGETNVVIRRRAGLMAVVLVVALGLSAGYLWRFAQTGGGVPLLLGVALGLVAVFHGLAWGDARTPLLVADETGLRVRLGGDWTGVPWSHVERVEVDERGRVRDGHVAVVTVEDAGVLDHARWRSRMGALLNSWFFDAPLVVPYGLTTVVTVVDVPAALRRLADGRAPIVVLDSLGDAVDEPEPTVALTTGPTDPAQAAEAPTVAGELPSARGAATKSPGWPLAEAVAALRSHPARREEVTLPVVREPVTLGTLALSEPYDDAETQPLPEIEQLRRRDDHREGPRDGWADDSDDWADDSGGDGRDRRDDGGPVNNVGLIIDATTDLSARAMSKVRRRAPLAASTEMSRSADALRTPRPADQDTLGSLVIGNQVRAARERVGLTVDELADRTRIRPYVIESLEVDDFRPCGGDFYARGHLRMLARVLGMDAEPLLTTYDEQFATSPVDPRAVFDAELSTGTTGMVRGGASGANWGGLIAAVLVLVLIWGVAKYFVDNTETPVTDIRSAQNSAGLGSPGPGNEPLPPPATVKTRIRLAAVGGDSRVVVTNHKRKVVFAGVLSDGQARMVEAVAPLHVMAANGGVVRLGTGGHTLGLMGEPDTRARHLIPARASGSD
jgi:hypothetical protein